MKDENVPQWTCTMACCLAEAVAATVAEAWGKIRIAVAANHIQEIMHLALVKVCFLWITLFHHTYNI